jgi:oligopeptidase B
MTDQPPIAKREPPIAKREIVSTSYHGRTIEDPYVWLKDPRWQEVMREPEILDREIRAHLDAENEYADAALASTAALQETLFAEMRGRIKEDDASVPAPDGPWQYYTRYETNGQYPIFCRRAGDDDSSERTLFHGDLEGAGKEFFRIAAVQHSPDHRRLAIGIDEKGSEYYALRVKDIETDAYLADVIEDASGDVEWAADGESFLYTKLDDNHRPRWVYSHRLGTAPADDSLIYEEPDAGFFVGLAKSESGDYLFISSHDHETSEVRILSASDSEGTPRLIAERHEGTLYDISEQGGRLFILTNIDGAEDFKVVEASVADPGPAHWKEIVPHTPGILIHGVVAFPRHLVRLETEEALPRIVVRDLESGEEHAIAVDEEAFSLGLLPMLEYRQTLRYAYSSPTTPSRVYDYDLSSRDQVLRKEQEIPSGHNPADYVTRRIHATSHDGERVPITIVHRKGLALDGSAPCLLYGYGSYGMSMPAAFETSRLSLIDRGFVYAVAHIRGGKEGGYRWYRTGKRQEKKNSFLDFIDSAKQLVADGYTSAGQIVIFGGSAGGLLVGATLNMAPQGLLKGAIAEVPFVDVLNTMLDADLPLTPPEWPEWGNPIEDVDAYDYIQSYSPYDNVEPREYPHLLATAGLTDPRVTYWEPAKWVAKLRATKTDDNLLLLRTRMGAGHGGASGRFDHLKELAEVYAFALLVSERAEG